jgi:mannonate dehydratase
MNIDMANPRCKPVYDALVRLDLPILVHVGEEKAVPGAERGDLANPLLLRHPLDAGVRVIAAHCASLGTTDHVPNIDLFARLMADRNYEGRLVGDISAITQTNRHGVVRRILLQRDWDGRLLNGSDYPLPGVMPLFSVGGLQREGVLPEIHGEQKHFLHFLRQSNALLYDFVVKRSLAVGNRRFPDSTFETRGFFERKA